MKKHAPAALLLTAILAAGSASAQAVRAPRPVQPPPPNTFARDAASWDIRYRDGARGRNEASGPTRKQWAQARHAAELINAGRCAEARDYAISQNDTYLTARVTHFCSGNP